MALVSDKEYPMRVAFQLMAEVGRTFMAKHGDTWTKAEQDVQLPFPEARRLGVRSVSPVVRSTLLSLVLPRVNAGEPSETLE